MKAQMKAIIASAVVIALCLAAVGGVTYSWFSDSEQGQINVSTATVDIDIEKIEVGSIVGYGTATATGSSVAINNLAAKCIIPLNIKIDNKSTIETIYIIEATIDNFANIDNETKNHLSVNNVLLKDATDNKITFVGVKANANTDYAIPLTISTDEAYDNQSDDYTAEGKIHSFRIDFKVTAYQGDYPTANIITNESSGRTTIPANGAVSGQVKVGGETVKIDTLFSDEAANAGASFTISASVGAGTSGFSIGGTPYTISLEKQNNLTSGYADVTVTIPCNTAPTSVSVIYNGSGAQPQVLSYSFDDANDKLTVTFRTTHFSNFIIAPGTVTVDNWNEFKMAISAGADIKLSENFEADSGLSITDYVNSIVDFNGKTITVNENNALSFSNGSFIFKDTVGNGGINFTANGCIIALNDSTVKIISGSYKSKNIPIISGKNGSISGGLVSIEGGTFEGVEGAAAAYINGKLNISGGTFTATDNAVIGTNGTRGWTGYEINISGGTFNARISTTGYVAAGLYLANDGKTTITGGTFNIYNGVGIALRSGELNLTGGQFNLYDDDTRDSGGVGDKALDFKVETDIIVSQDNTRPEYPGGTSSIQNIIYPYVTYNADNSITVHSNGTTINYDNLDEYIEGTPSQA